MQALNRIVGLVFRPAAEWDLIAAEKTSAGALLRCYILPLALLAPLATVIGMEIFNRSWDPVHGYLVPGERILATGAASYLGIIASIFTLAAIFAVIAPMFSAERDYLAALKVSAYGAIPLMIAGATLVLPVMAIVGMVALLHTLFLFWLGVRRVLNVPAGEGAEFVGISMVLFSLVSTLAGAAASALGLL